MSETKDLTPEEELKAQEAPKEEEIRENIISEYGFDEDDDSDKIDKLVDKEVEHSKKLSSAIGQKIKHRDKVAELEKQAKDIPPKSDDDVKIDNNDLDKKLDERFEKREIDDLEYSDDLKDEIQKIAKVQDISIKQALKDPYITYKVDEYEKEQKTEEATLSRNNKGGKKVFSLDNPPEVDMNTEEGRKEWDDWKQAQVKAGN